MSVYRKPRSCGHLRRLQRPGQHRHLIIRNASLTADDNPHATFRIVESDLRPARIPDPIPAGVAPWFGQCKCPSDTPPNSTAPNRASSSARMFASAPLQGPSVIVNRPSRPVASGATSSTAPGPQQSAPPRFPHGASDTRVSRSPRANAPGRVRERWRLPCLECPADVPRGVPLASFPWALSSSHPCRLASPC